MLAVPLVYVGSGVFDVSKYVTAVRGVVFNVFKLSVLPQSCPALRNVEWVWERVWNEIGILNIHFGQFSSSLFSSLVSHFLSTPMLAVGWCILEVRCLWYPNTSSLLWDVVFNVFKLSVLPHSCPELTNVEWVCVRVWIEIGILDIHFAHFSTSLLSSLLVSHFLSTPMLAVGWCILEVRCL